MECNGGVDDLSSFAIPRGVLASLCDATGLYPRTKTKGRGGGGKKEGKTSEGRIERLKSIPSANRHGQIPN